MTVTPNIKQTTVRFSKLYVTVYVICFQFHVHYTNNVVNELQMGCLPFVRRNLSTGVSSGFERQALCRNRKSRATFSNHSLFLNNSH